MDLRIPQHILRIATITALLLPLLLSTASAFPVMLEADDACELGC